MAFSNLGRSKTDKRGRQVCWCSGYWFPHRKGGGACEHSKTRDIHLALRHGDQEGLAEARVAHALDHPSKPTTEPCPF